MAVFKRLLWQTGIDNTQLRADALKTQSIFQTLGRSISKAAIFSAVGIGAAKAVKEMIKVNMQFEKSISTLSSLTGATGKALDFYKDKAIEFGEVTTQSATQVADAFKLVGSQMPQLLEMKEGLAAVTREAITLAEAAQIDVPQAAKALTLSLNQTGESADKASEFINILAAGSQKGAGDIPYLNAAIEKTGKVATDANLTFAEMVSVIEQLAPAISEPSSAGLHMNQVLLRLQKAGFGFSTGMFDLQEALHEVQDELDGIVDPSKRAEREIDIFGTRSITAGKVMLETKDKFKEFADEISDTNTAYEQAATNTDNLEGSITKLKSAVEGLMLRLGEGAGLNGFLKNIVDTATELVLQFNTLLEIIDELSPKTGELNEGWQKVGGTLRNLISPLRAMIKYNSILINGLKEALEWMGLLHSGDRTEMISKVRLRVEALQQQFEKLTPKDKDNFVQVLKDANAQFKKTEDLVEYQRRINSIFVQLEKYKEKPTLPFLPGDGEEEGTGEGDKEDTAYKRALKEFELIQQLEALRLETVQMSQAERNRIERNMEIQRLQFIRDNSTEITDLEREVIDKQIENLRRLTAEMEDVKDTNEEMNIEMAESFDKMFDQAKIATMIWESLGDIIVQTFESGEASAESFLRTLRSVTLKVISALIGEAVAHVAKDAFKKFGIKGLAIAPVVGAATYALMNAIVPKFKEGKPADFSGSGGLVPNTGAEDSHFAMVDRNEIILNPKQQAKLMWNMANKGFGGNEMVGLMKQQNKILKNAKQVVMIDNVLHIVKDGKLTGEKTYF